MNITDAFESFMAAAYAGVERESDQWYESQRVFIAGVHLTACMVKNATDPRGKALQNSAATMAYSVANLQRS